MRYVVSGGTDTAQMLLFDPGALPEDFDSRRDSKFKDWEEMHAQLTKEGRSYLVNTGSDGGYLLHAFVDEPLPDSLFRYALDPIMVDSFSVPSGQLWFAGAEYGFKKDDTRLRGHSHMGGVIHIPPGQYRLTLYRTEYPDDLMEARLKARVTPTAFFLHQQMGCFVGFAVLTLLATILTAGLALGWGLWMLLTLPIIALPFLVSALRPYREASKIWEEVQLDFPSVIAKLESESGQ